MSACFARCKQLQAKIAKALNGKKVANKPSLSSSEFHALLASLPVHLNVHEIKTLERKHAAKGVVDSASLHFL